MLLQRHTKKCLFACVVVMCLRMAAVVSNPHAKKLYKHLLIDNKYNKLIRPVDANNEVLTVRLGLRLSQLIGIDEKNQIMTTNVWLSQEWNDSMLHWDPDKYGGVRVLYVPSEDIWLPDIVLYNKGDTMDNNIFLTSPLLEWIDFNFQWDPEEYGGVDHLYVPAGEIWRPEIVLFNNADGNYQVTLMTKATVHHTGKVVWEPPAIYKSSCTIDVEFFPFDEQTCSMKFGSWSYDGFQVDLKHQDQPDVQGEIDIPMAMDLSGYYRSFIWDVLSVPARRNEVYYPCCPEPYPDVTFSITIRRKTLFYTVNLIIPCVAISFLTIMVFYLPSDSGEKITLCISILLALTVFFLLLSDLIPPTSLVVPLIGKYLLFTMILVTLSVIITVVVLNIHNRSPTTHTMSPWVRTVFLHLLPKVLLMKRPNYVTDLAKKLKSEAQRGKREIQVEQIDDMTHSCSNDGKPNRQTHNTSHKCPRLGKKQKRHSPELDKLLGGIKFIADHLREEDEDERIMEDWRYVAMVTDKLFLWLFTTACVVGTFGIILQAPTLYYRTRPLDVGI